MPCRNRVDPWGDLHAVVRAGDRKLWRAMYAELPDGSVVVANDGGCRLVVEDRLLRFAFDGWVEPSTRPTRGEATVLTPPTSVAALAHGYRPVLHPSARRSDSQCAHALRVSLDSRNHRSGR